MISVLFVMSFDELAVGSLTTLVYCGVYVRSDIARYIMHFTKNHSMYRLPPFHVIFHSSDTAYHFISISRFSLDVPPGSQGSSRFNYRTPHQPERERGIFDKDHVFR